MKIDDKSSANRQRPSRPRRGPKSSLRGLRILVGRARHQASVLSSGLRDLGAQVLDIPFIEIHKPRSYKPLDQALQDLSSYDWLILTSVNGVEALWARASKLRISRKQFNHVKIAAIGPATARAIEAHGLKVNLVPKEYVAESVVAGLRRKVKGKRVMLARAKVARDVIPRELAKLGARVEVVEAYETVVPSASRKRLLAALASRESPRRDHLHQFVNRQELCDPADARAGTRPLTLRKTT